MPSQDRVGYYDHRRAHGELWPSHWVAWQDQARDDHRLAAWCGSRPGRPHKTFVY